MVYGSCKPPLKTTSYGGFDSGLYNGGIYVVCNYQPKNLEATLKFFHKSNYFRQKHETERSWDSGFDKIDH